MSLLQVKVIVVKNYWYWAKCVVCLKRVSVISWFL